MGNIHTSNRSRIRGALVVLAASAGFALSSEAGPPGSSNTTDPSGSPTSGTRPTKGGNRFSPGNPTSTPSVDTLPASIPIPATIRDFKPFGAAGGHPDFEHFTGNVRVGLVAPDLDADGKPIATDLVGHGIGSEFRDAKGNAINPSLYDASLGDTPGSLTTPSGACLTSTETFAQWYRDVPGVNAGAAVTLTFKRVPGTATYVFDSANDEPYKSRGGFFPIDGDLYGNYASTGHNFHFTTELETGFVYRKNTGQVFTFTGDDDVWVFIGGKLVIDLGGVHGAHSQTIDLDRLAWLEDGASYPLKIFHAERHTTQSNFRIETTIQMRRVSAPAASALAD